MKRSFFPALLAATLACACVDARAHSFHAGLTDISFNAHTGSTEVVHTLMAHDVEALLTNLYGRPFDLSDADAQAVLRKYVEKQFWLTGADGKRLPLNWVGIEVDTDSVVVFQEAAQTASGKVAAIHDAVLADFLSDQVNTVNLTVDGNLRTFGFTAGRPEQSVR
ncbi:DUF6702 family protein [Massilia sp. 9096]|uniref:DUF6702 family protein n=1 Tax=Massilia sp. 9096 TaxID=1500894 RepID=UPI00056C1263|nr:DUF6702 family protein [Massilia sp. 9096]